MKIGKSSSIVLTLFAICFASCNLFNKPEPKEPYQEPAENDTLTVAQAIEYVKYLGTDSLSKPVFVKGVISNITKESDLFHRAIFDITDAGATETFTCYQVYYLQNKPFTEDDKLAIGDIVYVYGRIQNFKGKEPQTENDGKAYIYMHNGLTEVPKTVSDDKLNNITIAEAIEIIDTMANLYSKQYYQIECEISRITSPNQQLQKTGAVNMIITDLTGSMTAYQTHNIGNEPFTDISEVPNQGSKIVVVGKLTKFDVTYEIANGYIKEIISIAEEQ